MKRLISLLLAVLLLCQFCACTAMKKEKENEKIEQEETKKTETEQKEEESFLGTRSGRKYESTYIGLGCKLTSDWTYYNDEELSELSGVVLDRLDGDYRVLMENATVIYDMYALHSDGYSSISINMEKVSAAQLKNIDIKSNLELLMPTLTDLYEELGYENTQCSLDSVTIDGEKFYCVRMSADTYGVKIHQLLIQIPCKNHMASMTVTSYLEDLTLDYLDYFYIV